jgi:hypothetical protein
MEEAREMVPPFPPGGLKPEVTTDVIRQEAANTSRAEAMSPSWAVRGGVELSTPVSDH